MSQAVSYVNDNYKLVYPTATRPIQIAAPFDRPNTIMLQAIQKLLDQNTRIGPKGVAPEGQEPSALYGDAAYNLTRQSNEIRGDKYYEFDRANLNTFIGRIYLALLRDYVPTTTPPTIDGRLAAIERKWPGLIDKLAS